MRLKKKDVGLAALILMSLSGAGYADAPITGSTVINGDKIINVDTGSTAGINLTGNKEISLDAATPDAAVVIKVDGQRAIGEVRYGINLRDNAKLALSDVSIISEGRTGDVHGILTNGAGVEASINNLYIDVNGNKSYGVNVGNGAKIDVAGI